jgi:hypothetical protein
MHEGDVRVDQSIRLIPINVPQTQTKPRRRIAVYLFIAGAVLLSIASLVTMALTIARIGRDRSKSVIVTAQGDPTALRSESASVFSAFDARKDFEKLLSPEAATERRSIDAMLRRLEACVAAQDEAGFRELVDFDRLLKRVELTGCLVGWTSFDKRSLKTQLKASADLEPFWAKITLAGTVVPSDDPNTRVVYAYCGESDNQDSTEDRFWICRDGDSWKIYDWERLDFGLSESRSWSLYVKYAGTSEIAGFERWGNLLGEADALTNSGDVAAAEEKLRSAEIQSSPAEFDGFRWVATGYRWMALGKMSEAERCYRAVTEPIETPGALYGLMTCTRWKAPAVSLKYAEDYENAVGPTVDLLETKARLLESAGRNNDAASEWKKLLRLRPAHTSALAELFLALPTNDKADFERELERLDEPAAAAAQIATTIGYRDYPGLLLLAEYLERAAPQTAGTHYVAGLAKQLDGQHAAAAESFRHAFEKETDEAKRNSYINSYVEAMAADGQVIAAWQSVPDPKSAFETLVYAYDEDEIQLTDEEYRQLVKLYREHYPDDLVGLYREAELTIREERFEDAAELLRSTATGVRTEDDEEAEAHRASLAGFLATALYKLGKVEDAYSNVGERKERFSQLANLAIADKRWDDLRWLVEAHRAHSPDDPRIHYAEGRLAAQEKRWDDAVRHFRTGRAATQDEKWIFLQPLADAYIKSGRWSEFFATSDDPGEDFDSLARRFVADRNWNALQRLIGEHRQNSPLDHRVAEYQAEAAWAQNDYATYLACAQQMLAINDEEILPDYERRQIEDRVLSALLQSKQFDRARERAEALQQEESDSGKMAIVEAATGNLQEANHLALQSAAANKSATTFFHDDVAGRIFLGETFVELQREFPVEIRGVTSTLAVLLFEQMPPLDPAHISAALNEIGISTADVKQLKTAGNDIQQAFVVNLGAASVWVAAGRGKFNAAWQVEADTSPHVEYLQKSNGWLAVGTAAWSNPDSKRAEETARRVCNRLVQEQPVAICMRAREQWDGFTICAAIPEMLSSWETAGSLSELEDQGSELVEKPKNTVADDRQFGRSIREAARTFESGPDVRLDVVTFLSDTPPFEPLTLEVSAVRRIYGSFAFDGVLKNSSQLIPELKAGLPVSFWEYQIQACRLNGEQPVFRP